MIDDATSHIHARFVLHDSTEENMRLLWSYLEQNGRPLSFYTDKASLFSNAPKTMRDQARAGKDRQEMPPTQIGRALQELGIVWIAAHSLPASLSYVETRQVVNDYTIRFDNKTYQIARADIRAGLRGANVRVEVRLDGSLAVRFRSHYLAVTECLPRPKVPAVRSPRKPVTPRTKSQWMKNFHLTSAKKAARSVIPEPSPAPASKPIR
ncbi:MAG: hypothetical protein WBW33_16205 [Bryobacteraceae bacterium]